MRYNVLPFIPVYRYDGLTYLTHTQSKLLGPAINFIDYKIGVIQSAFEIEAFWQEFYQFPLLNGLLSDLYVKLGFSQLNQDLGLNCRVDLEKPQKNYGSAIKALPPPLSLMAVETSVSVSSFFLNDTAIPLPPPP